MQSYSKKRSKWTLLGLILLLFVTSLYSLMSGVINTSPADTLQSIAEILGLSSINSNPQFTLIIEQIRLPRLCLGILVGSGLAISGTVMQALFRNPMADPGLLGVSSGAALGAVACIVIGLKFAPGLFLDYGSAILPTIAFLGGLITLFIVFGLSSASNRLDIPTMLLAGVAVNSIAGALIGLLSYVADDAQLRDLIFWSLGSLEITDWSKLRVAIILVLPAVLYMLSYARALNANLLGESEARHLGVDTQRMKVILIILVSIVIGVSVALSGIIGFIGLLVPHLLRLVVGPDHRILLPASAIFGGILLVLADIIARTAVSPAEMPIGIITAILGGPFFLMLLVRQRRKLAI